MEEVVSDELRSTHGIFGCEIIQEAGILLHLPQVVMATGQGLLHRFYQRKSVGKFDAFTVGMGCILLACKVEETFKVLREILFVFHHMYQRRKRLIPDVLELGGKRYNEWKDELILMERYILKELGFSLYTCMDHPHKYILYYVKLLNGSTALSQLAWNYLNDSLRLDLCLRYLSQEIACAAIYLAARRLEIALPTGEFNWWDLMTRNFGHVREICNEILSLYKREKVNWLDPLSSSSYLSAEHCKEFDTPLLVYSSALANILESSEGDVVDDKDTQARNLSAHPATATIENSSSERGGDWTRDRDRAGRDRGEQGKEKECGDSDRRRDSDRRAREGDSRSNGDRNRRDRSRDRREDKDRDRDSYGHSSRRDERGRGGSRGRETSRRHDEHDGDRDRDRHHHSSHRHKSSSGRNDHESRDTSRRRDSERSRRRSSRSRSR